MFNDSRVLRANELSLQWHCGVPVIAFEAFQAWALAILKTQLRFDGALWGLLSGQGPGAATRITNAHLHGISETVLPSLEQVRRSDFSDKQTPGQIKNVCLADPEWQDEAHAALREHGHGHGLVNTLLVHFVDAHSAGQQFVLLARKAATNRFNSDEAASFELLAPHMMQAYATRRKLFLDRPQATERQLAGFAIVDRMGFIHDQHPRFVPILCREWSGWLGKRLPEPLLEMTDRRAGTRWRFVGTDVVADFVPIDDLYLVTARPRHGSDALTRREGEVAKHYVAGGNFREIAESLQVSPATVRSHLRNVFGKLKVRNKAQLAGIFR